MFFTPGGVIEGRVLSRADGKPVARAEVTLQSIGDAVLTTDAAGLVEYLNPVAEQLTGWSNAEAQDKPLDEIFVIIDEGNGKPVANPAGKVLAENRIVNLAEHAVLVSLDGRQIPIADTAAPIRLSEELAGVVLVFQDVSLKRNLQRQLFERAEKLEEANRRKNTFLAMLAHELRNPLAPISNAIQLLKLDPGLLTEVQQILDRQTGHLNRLLNDLLDVSRITQGKVTVNREMIDIASLIRLECSDNQSRFEQLGIDLQVQVPDHKVLVMADTTRLTQVIGNLLNNAQKFTRDEVIEGLAALRAVSHRRRPPRRDSGRCCSDRDRSPRGSSIPAAAAGRATRAGSGMARPADVGVRPGHLVGRRSERACWRNR